MPLWRIYPVAHRSDARWQGRKIWKDVVVCASSAAMARVIALELDRPAQPHRMGNESHCFRSGFEDAKLYWVQRIDQSDSGNSKPEGVVCAVLEDGSEIVPAPSKAILSAA
ncbi:MAG: hypothetical protein KGQ94_11640 [Alphaproteobacteria bacterium]|nr:hypothetical protein [Alphaproteobacteria bacterium]